MTKFSEITPSIQSSLPTNSPSTEVSKIDSPTAQVGKQTLSKVAGSDVATKKLDSSNASYLPTLSTKTKVIVGLSGLVFVAGLIAYYVMGTEPEYSCDEGELIQSFCRVVKDHCPKGDVLFGDECMKMVDDSENQMTQMIPMSERRSFEEDCGAILGGSLSSASTFVGGICRTVQIFVANGAKAATASRDESGSDLIEPILEGWQDRGLCLYP